MSQAAPAIFAAPLPSRAQRRRLQPRRSARRAAAVAVAVLGAGLAFPQACSTVPVALAPHVTPRLPSRRTLALAGLAAQLGAAAAAAPAYAEEQMKMEYMPAMGNNGKRRKKYSDYRLTPSGLQVKDADPGRPGGPEAQEGDTVVLTWEGYTINYFGRPFETQKLNDLSQIVPDPLRFQVGDGTVIPAIDEAVRGMREEGIRQLIVPVELGYDADKTLLPRPHTFSGQRALDFVLDNKGGMMDKTLLMNIKVKKLYPK